MFSHFFIFAFIDMSFYFKSNMDAWNTVIMGHVRVQMTSNAML